MIRRLTSSLRKKLKIPAGILFQGSHDVTINALKELIIKEKPRKIISVGDTVTESMVKRGLIPHVSIIDQKTLRTSIPPLKMSVDQTYQLRNPPGILADDAWKVIKDATKGNRITQVIVEGEEDLLTLVAVLHAPLNSLVIYGQPNRGIVVIKVSDETKRKAQTFVDSMEEF